METTSKQELPMPVEQGHPRPQWKSVPFWLKIGVSAAVLWLAYAAYQDLALTFAVALGLKLLPVTFLLSVAITVATAGLALALAWAPGIFTPLQKLRARLGPLRWVVALLPALAVAFVFAYTLYSSVFTSANFRACVYLATLGFMAWVLVKEERPAFTLPRLLAAGVLFGVVFTLAVAFQNTVDYPFSIGWSEGNRLWDYSIPYGLGLYDVPEGVRVVSLTNSMRRSLWGMPFLFGPVSIQFMRFWDAVMFTLPYFLAGLFIFRPRQGRLGMWLMLGLWTLLFINQGPIYTPLVLAAILVAAGLRSPLLLGMLLVALAGYYAHAGRYTWLFAPAMWAGMVAFLEISPDVSWKSIRRWLRPALFTLAGFFGGYILPEAIDWIKSLGRSAGSLGGVLNPDAIAGQVGRQPLLWERLWPNETYAPGIVLGLLMATGPLMLYLLYLALSKRWRLDRLQGLAIVGVLGAFLGVGLVVSVKIGGGSNLHNVDMFLLGLLFVAGAAWNAGALDNLAAEPGETRQTPDAPRPGLRPAAWLPALLLAGAVLYPASSSIFSVRNLVLPILDSQEDALYQIHRHVEEGRDKGDILFIDQRQLLTFGYVNDVTLVPEWEKKMLMDEAMAENLEYLDPFYQELAAHRFSVIVTEPLHINFQGNEYHFGNENDAWVKFVSIPILCYYEESETFMDIGVQIYVPKEKSTPREDVTCPQY